MCIRDRRGEALFQVASCFYNNGEYNKALKIFKKLAQINNNDSYSGEIASKASYQIAWCYWQLRKEEEAIKSFKQHLTDFANSSLNPDILFWLGKYHYRNNQFTKAREYFNRLLDDLPNHELADNASYWIGWVFYKNMEMGSALEQFKNMIVHYGDSELIGDALFRVGDILTGRKEYIEAIGYYQRALEKSEGAAKAEIQFRIARCYQSQKNLDQAKIEYLKVAYLYPEHISWAVEAKIRAAYIFEQEEKWDEARTIYEKLASTELKEAKYAQKRLEWIKDNILALSDDMSRKIMETELENPELKVPELIIPQTE